jgi:hypothetical protein
MPGIQGNCGDYRCLVCHPGGVSGYAGAGGGSAGWPILAPAAAGGSLMFGDMVAGLAGGWTVDWCPAGTGVPEVDGAHARERERAAEAAQRQAEAYAAAMAEQDRERAAARARAEQILLGWLSLQQQDDYRERQQFDVTGSDGRRWRILCQGQSGNVQRLDDRGEWTHAWCGHPRGLPDPVAWLTQAMAVAHDAVGFMKTANLYGTRQVEPPPLAADPEPVPEMMPEAAVARSLWNAWRAGRLR